MAYDATTLDTAKPSGRALVEHKCPECSATFVGGSEARFCTVKGPGNCKDAWHNRDSKRGRVATQLLLATVQGRRGSSDVATFARRELYALADQWLAEDKAAGRMSAAEYLTPKMEAGWRACDL
jgi:hypothetical protein